MAGMAGIFNQALELNGCSIHYCGISVETLQHQHTWAMHPHPNPFSHQRLLPPLRLLRCRQ
jgi:hypothetical protein